MLVQNYHTSSEARREEQLEERGRRSEQEEVEATTEEVLQRLPCFGDGLVVTACNKKMKMENEQGEREKVFDEVLLLWI